MTNLPNTADYIREIIALAEMTRPLPFDIARCGTPCGIASKCRRTTPGRGPYQAYSAFPGGDDCYGFEPDGAKP